MRSEILKTAHEVIVRDGVGGFAVSSVADEMGLTKPALYYYFDSKEALTFELWLREWIAAATEVQAAVEQTENGADAVETMMRTFFNRYREQLDLFMFVFRMAPMGDLSILVGPEELQRIHPVNDMLYAGMEKRLWTDLRGVRFSKKREARRFAFTAHTAVIGVLNMLAMVSGSGDPLVHSDDDLINDICQTYRYTTQQTGEN
jgi:AcrR family transcriptional regulator